MSEAEGLIVAAIIAGLVAFVSLIIGKEQTVSDCRRRWIDELRKDIAAIVACVSGVDGDSIVERAEPLWTRLRGDLTRFNELTARVRLRLNPDEHRGREGPATQTVLRVLADLQSIFASPQPEFHRIPPLLNVLVAETQIVLKENWDRVRSGERIYRATKWIVILGTAAAVVSFIRWTR